MSVSTASKKPALTLRQVLPDLILLPSIALLLSGIMTWANLAPGEPLLPRWGRGFLTCMVLLPFVLVSLGVLEKAVQRLAGGAHWAARKLAVALLAACLIESVLALAVTAINHGTGAGYGAAWWMAFSRSLPAGVAIGLLMCFYMKPKMDAMRAAARAAA